MRTVDAALTAALSAGNPTPYLKAYVGYTNGTVKNSHTNVVRYTLTGTSLEFVIPYDNIFASDQESIWLERGVTIAGTTYSVTTGRFFIAEEEYLPGGFTRYKGFIFPHKYYSDTGDATYESVIDAFCTEWGKTASFKNEAEAWLDYDFLPTGQVIIVNSAMRFLNMLQQKRLIQCCDNGGEDIRFYSADVLGSADVTITLKDEFSLFTTKTRRRQYIWRDENQTVHTDGTATDPLHNLGYLESTDNPPARNTQTFQGTAYVRPDLRLQDGDVVTFSFDGGTKTATIFAQVTEIFDASSTKLPKWRMLVEANPIYHATEGGAMPSTIERVSNYTPLNTSTFDGILSEDDNNLQAAMETIDNHMHWMPFGVFQHISPLTIDPSFPYAQTIDRSLQQLSWYQHLYVATTNNGSNYWTIILARISDGATVATLTTAAVTVNTQTVISTTTFAINPLLTSYQMLYVKCTKTGAPGALYLSGPSLVVVAP
jgi:hypothetical protein